MQDPTDWGILHFYLTVYFLHNYVETNHIILQKTQESFGLINLKVMEQIKTNAITKTLV